uniref:Uncharacterized protein n=1 Tax=Triticum urartu TaxID=4572 RepID=A0A8R7QYV2_TRIUA
MITLKKTILSFNLQMMEIREAVSEAGDSQTLKKIQSQVLLNMITPCHYPQWGSRIGSHCM